MKLRFKRILPYFIVSAFVVGFWWLTTRTHNYAWFPAGKEPLALYIALTSIFYTKTPFWLVTANMMVFALQQLIEKKYSATAVAFAVTLVFYFLVGALVDKWCASDYYTVFLNQSVSEEYIDDPLLEAGYQIGPILTEKITHPEMKHRRYAIGALGQLKYQPATPTLTRILSDRNEEDVIRADAFQALVAFDTDETKQIISTFRQNAKDSIDKTVIEYADYWSEKK